MVLVEPIGLFFNSVQNLNAVMKHMGSTMTQNELDKQLLSLLGVFNERLCPSQDLVDALRTLSMRSWWDRDYLSAEIKTNEKGQETGWEIGSKCSLFFHKDMSMALSAALVNIATELSEDQINKLFGTSST